VHEAFRVRWFYHPEGQTPLVRLIRLTYAHLAFPINKNLFDPYLVVA